MYLLVIFYFTEFAAGSRRFSVLEFQVYLCHYMFLTEQNKNQSLIEVMMVSRMQYLSEILY